jgi:hypothetical protein
MTKVVADITMSLDGFVTGPDPGPVLGLGRDGEALHAWVESGHEVDRQVLQDGAEAPGSVVMGRRLVQRDVRISPNATHLTYDLHT